MQPHNLVALVTLLALILYGVTLARVGRARGRLGVVAPAMTGHPEFERLARVQMNTLEGLVGFLPAMWLFAVYWPDSIAAGLGVVWIIGRFVYMLAYVKNPESRVAGFGIQGLATLILLIGGLIGAVRALMITGGV